MQKVFERDNKVIMVRNSPKNGKTQYAQFEKIWNGCYVMRTPWKSVK